MQGSLRKRLKNVHFEFVDPPFTSKHESIGEGLSWYEFSTVRTRRADLTAAAVRLTERR